jgi:hypothetical protein
MKEIKLTQGKVALVDDEDYEFLNQWKWHTSKNVNTNYACRSVWIPEKSKQKGLIMHRLIMNTPDGMEVDHVFHNGLDNRKFIEINGELKINLRNCTSSENQKNRKPCGAVKYLGVKKTPYGFRAQIQVNHNSINLGNYKTARQAACVYDEAAQLYHGEFANLNFK